MSNPNGTTLSVFLRQGRPYIQGTQILARCAETLDGPGWALSRAQFNAITDCVVLVSTDRPGTPHLGNAQFQRGAEVRLLHFYDSDRRATRTDQPMPVSVVFRELSPEQEAVYRYAGAADFEGALNILVQSVKSEHERRFEGAKDIWFTGIRNVELHCHLQPGHDSGEIRLSMIREMGRDGQHQTMWNFRIKPDDDGVGITGMTTFAYRTEQVTDAD